MKNTLEKNIIEAINEAIILESVKKTLTEDGILNVAMRLSGAAYSLVKFVYDKNEFGIYA